MRSQLGFICFLHLEYRFWLTADELVERFVRGDLSRNTVTSYLTGKYALYDLLSEIKDIY